MRNTMNRIHQKHDDKNEQNQRKHGENVKLTKVEQNASAAYLC